MLVAAARRFLALLALAAGVTTAVALALGFLGGFALTRSVSLGFYLVGCFLVIAGFFIGNRGPVRAKDDRPGVFFLPSHRRRWATREENEAAINDSAIFIALGFALILLGIAADSRYELF
jgi:hypothetical protein